MENYEQKYKEVLKAMESLYNVVKYQSSNDALLAAETLEKAFPELAESEDERIRKKIIRFLINFNNGCYTKPKETDVTDWISWLEKQSEKVIDCPQNYQDVKHPNGGIVLEDFNGGEGFYKLNLDYLDKKQVEEIEELVRTWNAELNLHNNENIRACIGMCLTDVDEQRFNDYNTSLKDCLAWLEKQGEQKPDFCHHEVDLSNCSEEYRKAYYDGWNNCNQQHAQLQAEQKSAWGEEDEQMIRSIRCYLNEFGNWLSDKNEEKSKSIYKACDWLKSLKNRVQPQPKQEWSEEDEKMLKSCITILEQTSDVRNEWPLNKPEVDWLKSLKPNHWKPSEEQMISLARATNCCVSNKDSIILLKLLEQLKKL